MPTQRDLLTWLERTWDRNRSDYGKKGIKRKCSGKSPSRSSEANCRRDRAWSMTNKQPVLWRNQFEEHKKERGPARGRVAGGRGEGSKAKFCTNYASTWHELDVFPCLRVALLPLSPFSKENVVLTKPKCYESYSNSLFLAFCFKRKKKFSFSTMRKRLTSSFQSRTFFRRM